jgi:hypothetical protein
MFSVPHRGYADWHMPLPWCRGENEIHLFSLTHANEIRLVTPVHRWWCSAVVGHPTCDFFVTHRVNIAKRDNLNAFKPKEVPYVSSPHTSHTDEADTHNIDGIRSEWLDGCRAQIRALLLVAKIRRYLYGRKSRRRTKSKACGPELEEFASTEEVRRMGITHC